MGTALAATGREEEALEHYRRMLPLAEDLDREAPRSGDRRWSSEARWQIVWLYMIKPPVKPLAREEITHIPRMDLVREEIVHTLRDPYLLTNTASTDLKRLEFTEIVLFAKGVYYMSVSNWSAAVDTFRRGLAFSEAFLQQSYSQHVEFHGAQHLDYIGLSLCAQGNHAEGLRTIDESLRRLEAIANREKSNWNFQEALTWGSFEAARARSSALRTGNFAIAERMRLLEEARDLYKRTVDRMQAAEPSPTRRKPWLAEKNEDIARELSELESELAALKASAK